MTYQWYKMGFNEGSLGNNEGLEAGGGILELGVSDEVWVQEGNVGAFYS